MFPVLFFLLNEVNQQNQNSSVISCNEDIFCPIWKFFQCRADHCNASFFKVIIFVPFSSFFNLFSHGTFWEEFKKDFLVGGAPHDLFSWLECCREPKLICGGSTSTLALMTLGRTNKVTILTHNNFVGFCMWWVIVSRTIAQTRTHTFCNNGDCTILYIWNRLICDVNGKRQ